MPEIPNLPERDRPSRTAAIRELFEETGILLADGPPRDPRALEDARTGLLANVATFEEVVRRLDATFTRAPMAYFARWITPRLFARRYDARFFLVAPGHAVGRITIGDEHTSALWIEPARALERFRRGELPMLFPTWKTLERLERFEHLEEAMAAFAHAVVDATEPLLDVRGDSVTPRLPEGFVAVTAPNPGPLTLEGTRTWIIGSDTVAIVDPGPLDRAHLDRVDSLVAGRPVTAVCLTHAHADHAEAAAEASRRWGRLHASAATLERLGLEGRCLRDGDEIATGSGRVLIALDTPGHSGDHLAYLCVPGREVLTGDLVLGQGSSMIAYPDGSVSAYLASLARLASLHPTRLLPGHGPLIHDPDARLAEYVGHRRARTEQVRTALAGKPTSRFAIRQAVYGVLPEGLDEAADLSLLATLEYLRESGEEVSATFFE